MAANYFNTLVQNYNFVENLYMENKNSVIPMENEDFSNAFFFCYDFLDSLTPNEIAMLKTDVEIHCKIVMFDTIKLHILAQNPHFLQIPGFARNF